MILVYCSLHVLFNLGKIRGTLSIAQTHRVSNKEFGDQM